jgi:hypothetical protein
MIGHLRPVTIVFWMDKKERDRRRSEADVKAKRRPGKYGKWGGRL